MNAEFLAALGIAARAQFFRGLDAQIDDFFLQVLAGDDGRDEQLRRRVVERGLGFRRFPVQKLDGNPLAAAAATISEGLEIVLY